MYVYLSQDQHNKEYLNLRFYLTPETDNSWW